MLWNQIQVKEGGVREILKDCLGHIFRSVIGSRPVILSFRGNLSDVVGSASIESDGESGFTGTARAAFKRSKIEWTRTKDKYSMMPLATKGTSLATFGNVVSVCEALRMWRSFTGEDRQGG